MTDGPWVAGSAQVLPGARLKAPAAQRNREPIAQVLAQALPDAGTVLEVASGTGEHAMYFAAAFPQLMWQPSDPDATALASIAAWLQAAGSDNLLPPLQLDAAANAWPVTEADAILCINMVHISPWEATVGLFTNGAKLLPQGAPLILYGPYLREGVDTAPGNVAFDADLRARNSAWGIRTLEDVTALAAGQGFALEAVHEMPANNLTVVYHRTA